MQPANFIIIFLAFFIIEIVYQKVAYYFNIIDTPNSRSSHSAITIRGGGIIFTVAALSFFFFNDFRYPYFCIGVVLIALISFLDDVVTLNNKVRIIVHLLSVMLLLWEWNLAFLPLAMLTMVLIMVIGIINAYNFMDGINGMTGCYSLITIGTLFYINHNTDKFIADEFLIYIIASLLVFNFFNFRTNAKCFAGDVGSIAMAYIVIFLLGFLMIRTQNYSYVLLLLVYGLDAVITILFRLIRNENIFMAHRSHFYQYLANEKKISHLYVSGGYALVQLLINLWVITYAEKTVIFALAVIIVFAIVFLCLRFAIEGANRLLNKRVD